MLNANIALKKRNHAELTVPQKQDIFDFRKMMNLLRQN